MSPLRLPVALFAFAFVTALACAQTETFEGPIQEFALVPAAYSQEKYELQLTATSVTGQHLLDGYDLEAEFGITDRLQLSMAFEDQAWQSEEDGHELSASSLYRISGGRHFAFLAGGTLERSIESGELSVGPVLVSGVAIGKSQLHLSYNLQASTDESEHSVGIGWLRRFHAVVPTAEFLSQHSDNGWTMLAAPGIGIRLGRSLECVLAAPIRLSGEGHRVSLLLKLTSEK